MPIKFVLYWLVYKDLPQLKEVVIPGLAAQAQLTREE